MCKRRDQELKRTAEKFFNTDLPALYSVHGPKIRKAKHKCCRDLKRLHSLGFADITELKEYYHSLVVLKKNRV